MKNIKSIFVNYKSIVNIIGEGRIEERLCALHDIYAFFLEQTGFKEQTDERPQSSCVCRRLFEP